MLALWAFNASAQPRFGADLDAMITHARSQHPQVAAALLDAGAAAARASAAESLPDPMFRTEFKDNTRGENIWPNRVGNRTYMVEQTFPLGGKRELRGSIASTDRDEADARRRMIAEDLTMRIKAVQAQRYMNLRVLHLLRDQHRLLGQVIEAADRSYEQGRGGQDAPLTARLNQSRHEVEIARMEGEQRKLDARLSALLGLDTAETLDRPRAFAPLPPMDGVDAESLLVLARERNPDLARQETRITRGERQRKLADAEWIPDITLGVGVVEEDLGVRAYEALVSFNIPLRWGLRDAQRAASVAETSSARAQRNVIELDIAGRLRESLATMTSQRRIEVLLYRQSLPQAKAASEAALRALEQGSGQIAEVLMANSRLRDIEIDLLKAQAEQRMVLAEIERIVGGEL